MEGLSILIPTYNQTCVGLVLRLRTLCEAMQSLPYEIIVADDCSTDEQSIGRNSTIGELSNCAFLRRESNGGSAATRNFLARHSHYNWLLYVDSDVEVMADTFIADYWKSRRERAVVVGGVTICQPNEATRGNLRYVYESQSAPRHTATERAKRPYKSFRSANFMTARDILLAIPFDERMRRYEDVRWGKDLRKHGIDIVHIENPITLAAFEANEDYLRKVETDLKTLRDFSHELQGYSTMLTMTGSLAHSATLPLLRLWHKTFGNIERQLLARHCQSLRLFNIYRLGYFATLCHQTPTTT